MEWKLIQCFDNPHTNCQINILISNFWILYIFKLSVAYTLCETIAYAYSKTELDYYKGRIERTFLPYRVVLISMNSIIKFLINTSY